MNRASRLRCLPAQCGKTFTSTLELALDVVRAEAEGRRTRWVILSRGERQAREAMNEGVKLHLRAMQAGSGSLKPNSVPVCARWRWSFQAVAG